MFASKIQRIAYRRIVKPYFFRQDPEKVHDRMIRFGKLLGSSLLFKKVVSSFYEFNHPALNQEILGIKFRNPVGLAAGFDKNAELTELLGAVGFGFEEIGSITGEPCKGNPKPRLWRLPKSEALIVYYGLKNDGAEVIAGRLKEKKFSIPIGVSVAKTNNETTVETEAGIADYAKAMQAMVGIGDYFTINISCPNAFGGEPFATPERLDALMTRLDQIETSKPIFVKLAADTSHQELEALVQVMDKHRVQGLIISNLTKKRDRAEIDQQELEGKGAGGISGKPTKQCSNDLIAHMFQLAGDRYVIIGVGGIFSAADAYEKICCGASLVQLITGMIYQGPQLIGEINRGLVGLLEGDGYKNIKEAIGSNHRK